MGRRRLKLPRYVHGYIDRHGKARHYLRRPGRKDVPLPGAPYSTEFMDSYQAALKNAAPVVIGASRSIPGSVNEAVARYLGSAAFAMLAETTQKMRRAVLERFRLEHGERRIRKFVPEHVGRMLGKLRPWAQRNMLKTLRGLAAFCITENLLDADPTAGVKLAKVKDTGGFATWSGLEMEQYRRRHPLGTRPRLAFELLLGTMAARSDVVRLGEQYVTAAGKLSFRRRKTGAPVDIPLLPELQAAIDAMPKAERNMTFLMTELGRPFTAAGFGNWFRDQCDAAGISKSAHGLRKAGATRLAEAGCSDHEIMAWGGWSSLSEVQRYTRAANRKRLAMQAAEKLKAGTKLANLKIRLANQGKNA
jgi:integrase